MTAVEEKKAHAQSLYLGSLICFILGIFMYLPLVASSSLSLVLLSNGYVVKRSKIIRIMSIIEIILYVVAPFAIYAVISPRAADTGIILASLLVWLATVLTLGIIRLNASAYFDGVFEQDKTSQV